MPGKRSVDPESQHCSEICPRSGCKTSCFRLIVGPRHPILGTSLHPWSHDLWTPHSDFSLAPISNLRGTLSERVSSRYRQRHWSRRERTWSWRTDTGPIVSGSMFHHLWKSRIFISKATVSFRSKPSASAGRTFCLRWEVERCSSA